MAYKSNKKQREEMKAWRKRNPEYHKQWRKDNPNYSKERLKKNPMSVVKFRARFYLQSVVESGIIIKPDLCSICGKSGEIQAHHKDYLKPLDVVWVCRQCHENIHHPE